MLGILSGWVPSRRSVSEVKKGDRMRIERVVCTLLFVTALTTLSLAQLTYSSSCTGSCETGEQCTYSDWAYTDSNKVKHSFPGSDSMTVVECKFEHFTDLDTLSNDKLYYLQAVANVGSVSPSGLLYLSTKSFRLSTRRRATTATAALRIARRMARLRALAAASPRDGRIPTRQGGRFWVPATR